MSKSAFYASKEAIRKTREQEYQELLLARDIIQTIRVYIHDNWVSQARQTYLNSVLESIKKYDEFTIDKP